MALAALSDVKRVLRITTEDATRDAELTAKLAVAEEWFRIRSRGEFDETAPAEAEYYAIRYGSILHLPVPGSTVTAVRAGSATGPATLGSDSYTVMDDRRVRIGRIDPWPRDPREQEPLGWSERPYYEKVEIDYTPPATVSVAVRDGIASIAAAMWKRSGGGETGSQNIKSEKIGDYSYTLESGSQTAGDDLWRDGLRLLHPFIGPRISST